MGSLPNHNSTARRLLVTVSQTGSCAVVLKAHALCKVQPETMTYIDGMYFVLGILWTVNKLLKVCLIKKRAIDQRVKKYFLP